MGGLCSKGDAGERQPLTAEQPQHGNPQYESLEDRLAEQRRRREQGGHVVARGLWTLALALPLSPSWFSLVPPHPPRWTYLTVVRATQPIKSGNSAIFASNRPKSKRRTRTRKSRIKRAENPQATTVSLTSSCRKIRRLAIVSHSVANGALVRQRAALNATRPLDLARRSEEHATRHPLPRRMPSLAERP